MLERKLYKTKLCILYQRGNCPRESCSFAHGDAELRRYAGYLTDENFSLVFSSDYIKLYQHEVQLQEFTESATEDGALRISLYEANCYHGIFGVVGYGRRDYRSGDLRDKLDRRHSPHQRSSPVKDARERRAIHGHKLLPHDKGYSLSRSPARRSDRRHRKKQQLGGASDDSGSPKISDGVDDRIKEGKASSYDEKDILEEQLKQTQLDIEMLDEQKCQLEIYLEEKVQETVKLSAKNEELKAQLNKDQEDCKRITSKIKKFAKVHGRYLRAQEELKRWQTRFQRLGEEFGLDTSKSGMNEEDSSINIVSEGEPNGDNHASHRHDLQNHASSIKKRLRVNNSNIDDTKAVGSRTRERLLDMPNKLEKFAQRAGLTTRSENNKEMEGENTIFNKNGFLNLTVDERKHKRLKDSASGASLDKVKVPESGHSLPSTSMAAHAVDELIEAIEMERSEAVEAAGACENGSVDKKSGLPFLPPPPPPITKNTYHQYEGNDEDVDVEEVDVEMGNVDLHSEVEIEQF